MKTLVRNGRVALDGSLQSLDVLVEGEHIAALGALLLLLVAGGSAVFAWTRELPHFEGLKDYRPLVSTRVLNRHEPSGSIASKSWMAV